MLDYARTAVAAVAGKARTDLANDAVLTAALERFIEVVGEAASKVSSVPDHHLTISTRLRDGLASFRVLPFR